MPAVRLACEPYPSGISNDREARLAAERAVPPLKSLERLADRLADDPRPGRIGGKIEDACSTRLQGRVGCDRDIEERDGSGGAIAPDGLGVLRDAPDPLATHRDDLVPGNRDAGRELKRVAKGGTIGGPGRHPDDGKRKRILPDDRELRADVVLDVE